MKVEKKFYLKKLKEKSNKNINFLYSSSCEQNKLKNLKTEKCGIILKRLKN